MMQHSENVSENAPLINVVDPDAISRGDAVAKEEMVVPSAKWGKTRTARLTLVGCAVGMLVILAMVGVKRLGRGTSTFDQVDQVEGEAIARFCDSANSSSSAALGLCTLGPQYFKSTSTVKYVTKEAVAKAVALAIVARKDCASGSLPFIVDPDSFLAGGNHTHFVHAQHKFDQYCKSETFKLNFHIGTNTSFQLQVNHDLTSQAWTLLPGSNPPICEIEVGSAGGKEFHGPNGKAVQGVAKFAAVELYNQMTNAGCCPVEAGGTPFTVKRIISANSQVVAGLLWEIKMEIQYASQVKQVTVRVLEHCANLPVCVHQLKMNTSICNAWPGLANALTVAPSSSTVAAVAPTLAPGVGAVNPSVPVVTTIAPTISGTPNPCAPSQTTIAPLPTTGAPTAVPPTAAPNPCKPVAPRKLDSKDSSADAVDDESDTRTMGHLEEDPTDILADQHHLLLYPRRLGKAKNPLMERYIKTGVVPSSHDPRGDACFTKIPIYDQGDCGSCYAQAFAQMHGIRLCMKDKGRRLKEEEEQVKVESQGNALNAKDEDSVDGVATSMENISRRLGNSDSCLNKYWSGRWTCSNTAQYCTSYPKIVKKCCPVTCSTKCLSTKWGGAYTCANSAKYCVSYATVMNECCPGTCTPPKPACSDSSTWKLGVVHDCVWFSQHDPGCTKYKDYGQRTHCKKTCNLCNFGNTPASSSRNQWTGAWYQYMPSVSQIAPCANYNGQMQGCAGGNLQGIWNNWMRSYSLKLWRMGASCKPYEMKCVKSGGVVNPLRGGMCSKYTGYELWHKPCSCIPKSSRPTSFSCPNGPWAACSVPLPPAAFIIKNVNHGLSIQETVLNIQRHVVEFGPIWASYVVTKSFSDWKWATNPVYTGGSGNRGGHVVNIVGWGTLGVNYWLCRNSWGVKWADGGYFKFQRGINLDTMESRGLGVSMPTSQFKDWSPPVCKLQRWSWSDWTMGGKLTKRMLTLKILCDKAATLKIFTSVPIIDHSAVKNGVSGHNHDAQAFAQTQLVLPAFNIVPYGFGTQSGDMWVQIKADDGKGNLATTSSFVNFKG